MKKTIFVNLFLTTAFLASTLLFCNSQSQSKFEIIGKTQGLKDSTLLYLFDPENEKFIDSTFVLSDSFYFRGSVGGLSMYMIQTKFTEDPKSMNYKILWIDNSKIYFEGKAGDFRNSKIIGHEIQQQFDELVQLTNNKKHSERQVIEQEFIKEHPNYLYSAFLLSFYTTTYGKDKTKELFDLLDPKLKKTAYGKKIQSYLKLNQKFEIGNKIAEIKLNDLKGESRSLLSLKGKHVLLEFWSSSCGACKFENPNLRKVYNQYKNKGFEIFAVTLDKNKKKWQNAVEADSINWITVSDLKGENGEAVLTYGINGTPANYLIDKNGIILAKDLRGEDLRKKMEEIFDIKKK